MNCQLPVCSRFYGYDRARFAAQRAEYLEAQGVDLSALDEPPKDNAL